MLVVRAYVIVVSLVASGLGCGGSDTPGTPIDSGTAIDTGGVRRDTGTRDTGTGVGCGGATCGPFEFCDMGSCTAYRGCLTEAMCMMGEVCRHRFCIPADADPDMDGFPASTDCDETNPEVNPGATEVCNGIDDDCNDMSDEGDVGMLCSMDPSGGICIMGACGCPPDTFDLDRDFMNGCECMASPSGAMGAECASAIDLGMVTDVAAGETLSVSGNVMPDDREVWYSFTATDTADTACDNFYVRAQFATNPADTFAFTIYRGNCTTNPCMDQLYTDFDWATDFRTGTGTAAVGECACSAPTTTATTNSCSNDSATFYVRVVRRPGSTVTCDGFTLEVTNGVFSTP